MQNCFLVGEKSPKFCVINWEVVPKCSSGLVRGSGQSPELLVLVFPFLLVLGKCSWDWVQGSGQSPELLVLVFVFHFLLVLGKWSLNWAWASVESKAEPRAPGPCFALPACPWPRVEVVSCSVFRAERTPGIRWDLWSWGRAVLWSSCNQAVTFHCFRDWKYLEFSNPWGQARVTPGSAGSRVFPAWSSHPLTSCSHQYNQLWHW